MTISNRTRTKLILAQIRDLRQVADDIEQGKFPWGISNHLDKCGEASDLGKRYRDRSGEIGSAKTDIEIRERSRQLTREWLARVPARTKKPSPDMLDQAQVLRQAANDLEAGHIDFGEVDSVISAFFYAIGFDYGYQRFLKDRRELLE
jgi:hypothetical protein